MKKAFVIFISFCMLFFLMTACAKKNLQNQSSLDQQASPSESQALSMKPAPAPAPAPGSGSRSGSEVESQDIQDAQARQKALQQEQTPKEAIEKFLSENVYFDFDSASLRADAQALLRAKAEYLDSHPSLTSLTIEGHTDERGTDAYNLALGDRRADAVKQFLVDLGLDPSRFTTISYGEERPLDPSQAEEAWAKNRRASFRVNP
jgi:peptidoglycan-associated lipoprotein